MLRPRQELAHIGRTAAVAFAVALVLTPTSAFSAKLRIPFFRPAAAAPARTMPAQPRAGVYVTASPRTAAAATTGVSPAGTPPVGLSSAGDPSTAPVRTASAATTPQRSAADEQSAHRKAWLDFCQPKLLPPDRYGVERYVYAHQGCQFGRTE
ncbi:MAG: hypothetical protein HXX10_25035 [Rhodoplanes sp.]|uniref:hypothetical protein n=1 Tax=Rhodoplanes sp. TaxID=1968906 RepID=UPI0017A8E102|nr:hypothetical protein [Rhodoplanes sp.]NVO17305.1 hypothetical protein [Rhodoplanes sp.]